MYRGSSFSYVVCSLLPAELRVDSNLRSRPAGILLPPHLYGELAKTDRGCELLRKHGDLMNLLHIARSSGAPADDRKGALWVVVSERRFVRRFFFVFCFCVLSVIDALRLIRRLCVSYTHAHACRAVQATPPWGVTCCKVLLGPYKGGLGLLQRVTTCGV